MWLSQLTPGCCRCCRDRAAGLARERSVQVETVFEKTKDTIKDMFTQFFTYVVSFWMPFLSLVHDSSGCTVSEYIIYCIYIYTHTFTYTSRIVVHDCFYCFILLWAWIHFFCFRMKWLTPRYVWLRKVEPIPRYHRCEGSQSSGWILATWSGEDRSHLGKNGPKFWDMRKHMSRMCQRSQCATEESVSIVIAQISKCTESFFRNHFPFFGSLSLKFASSDVALSKGMCKVVVNVTKTYKDLSSWRQPQAAMLWKWSSFLQAAFWSFWCFLFGSMDLYSLSDFKWLVFSLFSSTTLVRSNRKFTHPNHPFLSHSCSGIDIYWHLESQASQQSLVIPVQTSRSLASDKPWKTALSSSGFGRSLRCSWRLGLEKVRSTHDGFGIPGVLHVVLPEVSLYRAGDCIFRFVYFDLP